MAFENLSDREKQVLANLIRYYINTADPVGSRVIANKFNMGVSSATIRNTLQDLEELGLVRQPHTSAGRIPTDLGYRVYVDYLLQPDVLSMAEQESIRSKILSEGRGINEILGQTCRVLGEITSQLGVAVAPKFEKGILRRVELIPVTEGRIMVIVVVESGLASTVIVEVEVAVDDPTLLEVSAILNERLAGLTLGEIRRTISQRLADVTGRGKLVNLLIDSKDKIWASENQQAISLFGAEHLLAQPEFADAEKLSGLLKLLENSSTLTDFLETSEQEGIVITIGHENPISDILNCSLVQTAYRVGRIKGTVAVIGPTRMEYSKLVSVVNYAARTITEVLGGYEKETNGE